MLRVLIADDHAVVRKGLQQIVADVTPMIEVDEAADSEEVLAKLSTGRCDCLVLDISMPGRSGLDILSELRHLYPALPVLILSMHPEDQYATRVLKAGAAGYLVKDSAPDELVNAIHRVVGGGKYVSATLAEKLALGLCPPATDVDGAVGTGLLIKDQRQRGAGGRHGGARNARPLQAAGEPVQQRRGMAQKVGLPFALNGGQPLGIGQNRLGRPRDHLCSGCHRPTAFLRPATGAGFPLPPRNASSRRGCRQPPRTSLRR